MKISYLDGPRLKQAIIAASKVIDNMQYHLNKINVFPVPDGDTGTNMASTMNHISNDLSQCTHRSIGSVSLLMAESALMGAQGNSGVILAQFFNGFAEAVDGKLKITTTAFAEAVRKAQQAAINAISNPKEGTILTVIKDWVNKVEELCTKHADFVDILQNSLKTAKKSLAETPLKLKVLAKAGVVDAGAEGFVHLLEGITQFIERGKISFKEYRCDTKRFASTSLGNRVTDLQIYQSDAKDSASNSLGNRVTDLQEQRSDARSQERINISMDLEFRFCTECVLHSDKNIRTKLQEILNSMGDSLIIANKGNLYRIHIHTNQPEHVFERAMEFGVIEKRKVDDMAAQHRHLPENMPIAVIIDSACDLPYHFLQEHKVHIVPTKVTFGPETYLDKVEITPIEFYDKLLHSKHHPTTSQPSIASYKEVYEEVSQNYDYGISIHLPRVASGTLQSAENSAELFGNNKITCIDGKTVSIGLGLIVMEAVRAISNGDSLDEVLRTTKLAIDNVYIYISIPNLNYAVRGGRVSKPKWFLTKMLNIKPVLTFDKDGRVQAAGKAFGDKAVMKKTLQLVRKKANKYSKVKFMVAHANAYNKAVWYVEQLKNMFDINEEIPIVDAAPALGVHAGPGTAAIALLGYQ